jgi:hypothetical protein
VSHQGDFFARPRPAWTYPPPPLVVPPMGPEHEATIQARFEEFHATNPWVFEEIVRLAQGLADRGHQRFGIGMVFEVLRWQRLMHTEDPASTFKLNNTYRSRYARLLAAKHPDLGRRLELRELQSE